MLLIVILLRVLIETKQAVERFGLLLLIFHLLFLFEILAYLSLLELVVLSLLLLLTQFRLETLLDNLLGFFNVQLMLHGGVVLRVHLELMSLLLFRASLVIFRLLLLLFEFVLRGLRLLAHICLRIETFE